LHQSENLDYHEHQVTKDDKCQIYQHMFD